MLPRVQKHRDPFWIVAKPVLGIPHFRTDPNILTSRKQMQTLHIEACSCGWLAGFFTSTAAIGSLEEPPFWCCWKNSPGNSSALSSNLDSWLTKHAESGDFDPPWRSSAEQNRRVNLREAEKGSPFHCWSAKLGKVNMK